jgi:hypothetical protein
MNLPTHGDMPRLLRKPFSSRELGDALDQLDTP